MTTLATLTTDSVTDPRPRTPRRRKLWRLIKWSLVVILLAVTAWTFIAYWTSTNDFERQTAAPKNPIKAILKADYGYGGLRFVNVNKPVPEDDQLLVKVRAASVNPLDGHTLRGELFGRVLMGSGLCRSSRSRGQPRYPVQTGR
jgi:hypothetical protein